MLQKIKNFFTISLSLPMAWHLWMKTISRELTPFICDLTFRNRILIILIRFIPHLSKINFIIQSICFLRSSRQKLRNVLHLKIYGNIFDKYADGIMRCHHLCQLNRKKFFSKIANLSKKHCKPYTPSERRDSELSFDVLKRQRNHAIALF